MLSAERLDPQSEMRKTVLIFRKNLLPISETFIRAQANALRLFEPRYIGLQPAAPSLCMPSDTILLCRTRSPLSRVRTRIYNSVRIAPTFHRKLRHTKPALVHAHFAPDGAIIRQLCNDLKLPLIVTLHGYDVTEMCDFENRYRLLRDRAAAFICISEFIRKKALAVGFPKDKLLVHYIGVDCTQFSPSPAPPEEGLVLFVGRLTGKKGCEYAIRATQRVQQQHKSARLVVIGDGPLRPSLQDLARQLGVRSEFLGAQPSNGIRNWLGRASLFCAPSVSEGLGIVFLEAQAMGVPVVSFDQGGIPEAVAHGETGLLAPERNHELLAQHILTFLTDKSFRDRCGAAGRERVERLFNLHTQTPILEQIYEQVLTHGAPLSQNTPISSCLKTPGHSPSK